MGLLNIGTSMCLKTSKQECGRGPKPGHRGIWPKPSGISNFCSFSPFPCKAFIADVGPILVSSLKRLLCIPGLFGEEAGLSCLAWLFPCRAYTRWLVGKRRSVHTGTGVCGSQGMQATGDRPFKSSLSVLQQSRTIGMLVV